MFYDAILRAMPGKNTKQKIAFLKSQGFDVLGTQQQEYQPKAAPVLTNPVGEMYKSDRGLSSVFGLIQHQGMDPISAVAQARKDGFIPAYNADPYSRTSEPVDYLKIAQDFANAQLSNKQKLDAFNTQEAARQSAWQAKQKTNLPAVIGQQHSVYQDLASQLGHDFTSKDLIDMYAKNVLQPQASAAAATPQMSTADLFKELGASIIPAAPTAPVANPWGSDALKQYVYKKAAATLDPLLVKAKNTVVLDPKVSQLIQSLSASKGM